MGFTTFKRVYHRMTDYSHEPTEELRVKNTLQAKGISACVGAFAFGVILFDILPIQASFSAYVMQNLCLCCHITIFILLYYKKLSFAAHLGASLMLIIQTAGGFVQEELLSTVIAFSIVSPCMQFFINDSKRFTFIAFILNMLSNRLLAERMSQKLQYEELAKRSELAAELLRSFSTFSFFFMVYGYVFGYFILAKQDRILELHKKQRETADGLRVDAQKALSNRNMMFSTISHELRNPLNCLIGSIELALRVITEHQIVEVLKNGKVCGELLLNMINNILDNAKVDFDTFKLNNAAHSLAKTIERVWNYLRQEADQKQLVGEIYVMKGLPLNLIYDDQRLIQVIINLLSNALKYTTFGSIKLIISAEGSTSKEDTGDGLDRFATEFLPPTLAMKTSRVKTPKMRTMSSIDERLTEQQSKYHLIYSNRRSTLLTSIKSCTQPPLKQFKHQITLRIQVVDSGCGILKHDQNLIFKPFFCEKSTNQGRTGLGMYMTKAIIERMHGTIDMDSLIGHGTVFSVQLPMEIANVEGTLRDFEATAVGLRIFCNVICIVTEEAYKTWRKDLNDTNVLLRCCKARELLEMPSNERNAIDVFLLDPALLTNAEVNDLAEAISPKRPWRIDKQNDIATGLITTRDVVPRLIEHASKKVASIKSKNGVLIVDDDQFNVKILSRFVSNDGYTNFLTAANGEEAFQTYAREKDNIRIVLMDNEMPICDGATATKKIIDLAKSTGNHVRVIGITGNVTEEKMLDCISAGMSVVLKKPVTIDELARVMLNFITIDESP